MLPAEYREISTSERDAINKRYHRIWHEVFASAVGFGTPEPNRSVFGVPAEDREAIFQDLWKEGSGFRFMFAGFSDIVTNEEADKVAIDFIHKKIKEIVKDSQKAKVLTSSDYFARRPLTDDKYCDRFNQDNVFAVDLKKTPITEITPFDIKTSDGRVHGVDLVVFATGFDAVDGSYFRIVIKGRNGKRLEDHWAESPRTHLGATTSDFPNLLFVNGPGVPFANNPPVAETSGHFAVDLIAHAEEVRKKGLGSGVIQSTPEADEQWLETQRQVAAYTLFSKTPSWFFGENIPGRKVSPRFFFGGIAAWRKAIAEVKANGYAGFTFGEH